MITRSGKATDSIKHLTKSFVVDKLKKCCPNNSLVGIFMSGYIIISKAH